MSKKARKVRKKQSKGLDIDTAPVAKPKDTCDRDRNPDESSKLENGADSSPYVDDFRSIAVEPGTRKHFDTIFVDGVNSFRLNSFRLQDYICFLPVLY